MLLTLKHFRKTVTTAGTRIQLTTNEVNVVYLIIQALTGNTGRIYIGNNQVASTSSFVDLAPDSSISLDSAQLGLGDAKLDMSKIWLDSSVSGEGVNVGYIEVQG